MKKLLFLILSLFIPLLIYGCNTAVNTYETSYVDSKATESYTSDSITEPDIIESETTAETSTELLTPPNANIAPDETNENTDTKSESVTSENSTEQETILVDVIIKSNLFGSYNVPETGIEYVYPETTKSSDTTNPPDTDWDTSKETTRQSSHDKPYAPKAAMYHSISEIPYSELTSLFVRPSEFSAQLDILNSLGYTYLFADEYSYTPEKSVILTFDDGYSDNYTDMFPILKEKNAKATIFMITGNIGKSGYLNEAQIREMAESGLVSFQSHTVSHSQLTSLDESRLRYEFETSIETLEELTGREVLSLCYPAGRYNRFVRSIASDYFSFAYTTVSSSTTAGYASLELPRIRVSRGMSSSAFKNYFK